MDSRNKLMDFLMGLNEEYESVRSQILTMEPMPAINKTFYLVEQVEKQKHITRSLNIGASTNGAEGSGLNANKQHHQQQQQQSYNQRKEKDPKKAKDDRKCDYCGYKGHIKSYFYKLHDYPNKVQAQKREIT